MGFGAESQTISTSEPRAWGLRLQQSSYGHPIPIHYGKGRLSGNLIWKGDFEAIASTSKEEAEGKGGGGVTTESTTYTYRVAFQLALCEGPIETIIAYWAGKKRSPFNAYAQTSEQLTTVTEEYTIPYGTTSGNTGFHDSSNPDPSGPPFRIQIGHPKRFQQDLGVVVSSGQFGTMTPLTFVNQQFPGPGQYSLGQQNPGVYKFHRSHAGQRVHITYSYLRKVEINPDFEVFFGTYPQEPWGYHLTRRPQKALHYEGTCYVAKAGHELGGTPNMPNLSFEVIGRMAYSGAIHDCDPRDVVIDYLTNPNYGAEFPGHMIGDSTEYSNYCVANNLFISPTFKEQKEAHAEVDGILKITNSCAVWSEGLLKFKTYGDGQAIANGVAFNPNLTPIYDLDDDSILATSGRDEPIKIIRKNVTDAFNSVEIEFDNRETKYNVDIEPYKDQANIEQYGVRSKPPIKVHAVKNRQMAQKVAQFIVNRDLYLRNTYEFKLGWKYCLLEPMDIVTLNCPARGLVQHAVRIVSVEEAEDGELDIVAEDLNIGVTLPAIYGSEPNDGYSQDYNVAPGPINNPVFMEAPFALTDGGFQIWIAISGGVEWGGCKIFISQTGESYRFIGEVHGKARHGILLSDLPAATDPDAINSLVVDLSQSRGVLSSASLADTNNFHTLCYVDGEYIAYQTATLIAPHVYVLRYLRRGVYDSPITSHSVNSQFARCDGAVFKYPFDLSMIGKPVYLKFPSFNTVEGGMQSIGDVEPFTYTMGGLALTRPMANVQNLTTFYKNGIVYLTWDEIPADPFRYFDYEIRKGATFLTAQIMGYTQHPPFETDGDGTYFVVAASEYSYSSLPASVVITGSVLQQNVVAEWDEDATGWTGVVGGSAAVVGGDVKLGGTSLFSSIPVVSAVPIIGAFGGIGSEGTYDIPTAHEIDLGNAQECHIAVDYTFRADNPNLLFSAIPLVSEEASIIGNYSQFADVVIQMAIAPQSGVYGGWLTFVPGSYILRKVKFRALLKSFDSSITAILTTFRFLVDMPDRDIKGNGVALAAAGTTFTYPIPFQVKPNVQITVVNAQAGDQLSLTGETENGFTARVLNGGTGVIRTINYIAQGY